jgi:hypothetical protein
MRRKSWILMAGVLVTGSACAHRGGAAGGAPPPATAAVRLEVTNDNSLPMEVYVVGAGVSRRLGLVSPGMVGRFVIPQGMLGDGPIEVEARGGAEVIRSGQLLLAAGQVVDFKVGTRQMNSTATVRP